MDVFSAKHLFFVFVVLLIFSVVSDCSGEGDEKNTPNNGTTTIEVNATTTPAIISPSSTTEATSQSSQLTTTISVLSSTESTSSQPQSLQPTTISPSSTAETLTSSPSQTTQLITTTSSSSMTENVISTSPSQNSTQPITTKTLPATEPKTLALTQTAPPPTKEVKTTEKTSTSKTTAITVIPTWRRKTVFKGSLTTTPTPIHECLPYPFMIVAISVSAVGGLTVLTFTVLFLVYVLKKKCRSKPKQSIEKVELQVGDYENQM